MKRLSQCMKLETAFKELKGKGIWCCRHCQKEDKNTALLQTTAGQFDVCCTHEAHIRKLRPEEIEG